MSALKFTNLRSIQSIIEVDSIHHRMRPSIYIYRGCGRSRSLNESYEWESVLSSAKLCMLLVVEDTRSLMKIGNNVGDNSVPRPPTSPSVYRKYVNAFGTTFLVEAVSILPVERLYWKPYRLSLMGRFELKYEVSKWFISEFWI